MSKEELDAQFIQRALEAIDIIYVCPMCSFNNGDYYKVAEHVKTHKRSEVMG